LWTETHPSPEQPDIRSAREKIIASTNITDNQGFSFAKTHSTQEFIQSQLQELVILPRKCHFSNLELLK